MNVKSNYNADTLARKIVRESHAETNPEISAWEQAEDCAISVETLKDATRIWLSDMSSIIFTDNNGFYAK